MKVIVITGPTGVGKSKIANRLAPLINGEIINADSRQIYQGMEIATAKEINEQAPHHLFNIKKIDEEYSVYDYQKDCRHKIKAIHKKGAIPILVGGTGLYIKAALYDYQFMTNKKDYQKISNEELYQKLQQIDPENNIHKNNRPRLEQALSYYEQMKKLPSEKEKNEKILYDVVWIGLTMPREKLYDRINKRVDKMMEQGLIDEALAMYQKQEKNKVVLTAIGYKELFAYFREEKTLTEATNEIKKRTRNYAKRQYTWFNNQLSLKWFSISNEEKTTNEILSYLKVKNIK